MPDQGGPTPGAGTSGPLTFSLVRLATLEAACPFEQGIFIVGTIVHPTLFQHRDDPAHEALIEAGLVHDPVQVQRTGQGEARRKFGVVDAHGGLT